MICVGNVYYRRYTRKNNRISGANQYEHEPVDIFSYPVGPIRLDKSWHKIHILLRETSGNTEAKPHHSIAHDYLIVQTRGHIFKKKRI